MNGKMKLISNWKNMHESKSVLILNRPHVITDNNFYIEIFRIPEVLNRLRQYREILNENDMNIPIWVYCLTQDIKSLVGSPQPFVLHFLVSLGLFDRYTSRNGWPSYIIGSDPLMSLIAGEISFEEQVLLLTNGYCQESGELQLYQASSYYNNKTGSFCLTSLKRRGRGPSLKEILINLQEKFKKNEDFTDWAFQLLSPHEDDFMDDLKSYGIFSKDFLEWDQGLKWLWPLWKRTQMKHLKKQPAQIC